MRDVWVAAHLAREDEQINAGTKGVAAVAEEAESRLARLNDDVDQEDLASRVYALFRTGSRASKAIAAQYFVERLETRVANGDLTKGELVEALPSYLVHAIEYVTGPRDADRVADLVGNPGQDD